MRASAAARRYARALFSLASEAGQVPEVRSELDVISELFEQSQELRDALLTPLRPVAERKAVLAAVVTRAGISNLVRHFYSFLIDQRRLLDFEVIRAEYVRLADEKAGLTIAHVITAAPLAPAQEQGLARALSGRTGMQVRLAVDVDPGLLGGLVAKVGDLVFDGSLRTQLTRLRANLTKES